MTSSLKTPQAREQISGTALSPLEALQKARDLVSDPKRWTQNAFARDEDGRDGPSYDGDWFEPVCFCSLGALAHVCGMEPEHELPGEDVLAGVIAEQNGLEYDLSLIHEFNDSHTHAEVLAIFDLAIARASSSEDQP